MKFPLLFLPVAVLAAALPAHAAELPSTCAATPQAAVRQLLEANAPQSLEAGPATAAADPSTGFRVVAVHEDPLRGRQWAMVADCAISSRPMNAVALPPIVRAADPQADLRTHFAHAGRMLVHTGEAVQVRMASGDSSIELQGWVQESAAEAGVVHVRLPRLSVESTEAPAVIRCRVVREGVVEVIQ